jgi:hypothetical protein
LRRVAQIFFRQRDLLVIFLVHKVMMRAVGIQIFHIVLFHRRALKRIV